MVEQQNSRLADFFLPVMEKIRRGLDAGTTEEPAELAATFRASLDQACAQAIEHGHNSVDVDHALFAIVAWLDEMAMSCSWAGASAWRLAPLQRHYFATTRAGSEFYERLNAVPDDDAGHAVQEVYALALVSGFRGEYGTRSASAFSAYTRQLLERVQNHRRQEGLGAGLPVFPGALPGRHLQSNRDAFRRGPATSVLLILGIPLGMLVAAYLYLDFSLGQTVAALIGRS